MKRIEKIYHSDSVNGWIVRTADDARLWVIGLHPAGWFKRAPLRGRPQLTECRWDTLLAVALRLCGVPPVAIGANKATLK